MASNIVGPLTGPQPIDNPANGVPIIISSPEANTYPGVMVHKAETDSEFIWLWLGLTSFVDFTDAVYVKVIKGTRTVGGQLNSEVDSVIRLPSDQKLLVDSGTYLDSSGEVWVMFDTATSTLSTIPSVAATGFVHKRISTP